MEEATDDKIPGLVRQLDGTPVAAPKIKMTKPELKAKIRELKVLRWQALESNENKKAVMLRQQISQLKKKSRRIAAA